MFKPRRGPKGQKEARRAQRRPEGPKEARRANRLEVGARRAPELLVSEYLYSSSHCELLRVSFKALCHLAKDLAEQVGYGCDEVEE